MKFMVIMIVVAILYKLSDNLNEIWHLLVWERKV